MFKINIAKKINTESGPNELLVKLNIKPGVCTAITGCSGAGKTTLLRMIAGLTKPDRGYIKWESDVWFDSSSGIYLPPQKRAVGFVFQNHALFPHLSVKKNISFACKSEKRVNALIDLAGLGELRDKRPGKLSGGQRQRVALMRSIALNPKILLLDEPLSALDIETRHRLQNLILKVQSEINLTILLVSHDEYEIGKLAKDLVLIENNKISVLPILNKRGLYEDSLRLW